MKFRDYKILVYDFNNVVSEELNEVFSKYYGEDGEFCGVDFEVDREYLLRALENIIRRVTRIFIDSIFIDDVNCKIEKDEKGKENLEEKGTLHE